MFPIRPLLDYRGEKLCSFSVSPDRLECLGFLFNFKKMLLQSVAPQCGYMRMFPGRLEGLG